jgi:hypothetical protein
MQGWEWGWGWEWDGELSRELLTIARRVGQLYVTPSLSFGRVVDLLFGNHVDFADFHRQMCRLSGGTLSRDRSGERSSFLRESCRIPRWCFVGPDTREKVL